MCTDGISESLIEKLKAYSQMPDDNLESFRSVTAKLHSRSSSQDKLVKEQTLECISNAKTGILELLLRLLQVSSDDIPVLYVLK
ncbi:hypothetical protein C0J52_18210 [Blattella germanica]|nr:hypothetical protein C0J52_18210 [Blattella germanica]